MKYLFVLLMTGFSYEARSESVFTIDELVEKIGYTLIFDDALTTPERYEAAKALLGIGYDDLYDMGVVDMKIEVKRAEDSFMFPLKLAGGHLIYMQPALVKCGDIFD